MKKQPKSLMIAFNDYNKKLGSLDGIFKGYTASLQQIHEEGTLYEYEFVVWCGNMKAFSFKANEGRMTVLIVDAYNKIV